MQTHSFVLFVLSRFNYNISAVFLLFYFADDLVSQKNGETQNNIIYTIAVCVLDTNSKIPLTI